MSDENKQEKKEIRIVTGDEYFKIVVCVSNIFSNVLNVQNKL